MEVNAAINEIATLIAHPFLYLVHPGQRVYVLYLLAAVVIAFGVYVLARRRGDEPSNSFLRFCFPKEIYLHPSSVLDYKFFFVNRIAFVLFLGALILSSSLVAKIVEAGLGAVMTAPAHAPELSITVLAILLTATVVIAKDFGIFFAHYLLHKVPFLWEFHKVHHSAQTLTPMTVYRMHPVDDILTGSLSGALAGAVYGVFAFFYEGAAQEIKILHLNVVVFVFYLAGYNLRHSHIWLPLKGIWGKLFISPAHHQLHHSSELRHADKNMGFIFGVWDWLFGTLYIPEKKEAFRLGLHAHEDEEFTTLSALYFLPFRKALARLRRPIMDARA